MQDFFLKELEQKLFTRIKEEDRLTILLNKMKGLRVDSFLQCIPPRRLGHLFCKRRSAQANFYQFRRKVRGSGTIRPSLRYAISVCKVNFSRRPAFETSGLRDFTANEHR